MFIFKIKQVIKKMRVGEVVGSFQFVESKRFKWVIMKSKLYWRVLIMCSPLAKVQEHFAISTIIRMLLFTII